jgi:hypothetical protein
VKNVLSTFRGEAQSYQNLNLRIKHSLRADFSSIYIYMRVHFSALHPATVHVVSMFLTFYLCKSAKCADVFRALHKLQNCSLANYNTFRED